MNLRRPLIWAAGAALGGLLHAEIQEFEHSQPFSLGPGETEFAITFPQFDISAHPTLTALDAVEIKLEVTFAAGVMLSGIAVPTSTAWSLGPARASLVAQSSGLATPSVSSVSLEGTFPVPAGTDVFVTPPPSLTSVSSATVAPPDLGPYLGTGTIAYDLDFAGLYHQVATAPPSVAGLYTSDRVTGTLTVTYRASGPVPTAITLNYFGAQRESSGWVAVNWETGVEYDILGFHVERQTVDGEWIRITPELIPSMGSTNRSWWYRFEDRAAPVGSGLRYRLVTIDLAGDSTVEDTTPLVAGIRTAIQARAGSLEMLVTGLPGARFLVEVAPATGSGPWSPQQEATLDATGRGSVFLGAPTGVAQFYRVRQL